jgi:catechol 2,3-dioxygenase-like lactoylglutathione lyase family enzyme
MNIQHLHLHVRECVASEAFYERWLGLHLVRRGHEITFMEDDAGFSLALMQDADPVALPDWFHFGSRLDSPQALERMHAAMTAASISIVRPLYRDETLASFRCRDPDGYAIEIYWEVSGCPPAPTRATAISAAPSSSPTPTQSITSKKLSRASNVKAAAEPPIMPSEYEKFEME